VTEGPGWLRYATGILLSNLASLITKVETALLTRNRKTLVNLAFL